MSIKDFEDNYTSEKPGLPKKEGKYINYAYCGWVNDNIKCNLPKVYRPMMHSLSDGTLLIICCLNDQLIFYTFNQANNKVSEIAKFSISEYFHVSGDFIHYQSILLQSRYLYLIKNSYSTDEEHIFFFDILTKKLYPIKNDDTRPKQFRINYTVNISDHKLYFFGGMTSDLEALNELDTFNLLTYKWEVIQTKGKSPDPRHSHYSFLIGQNFYVMGGTNTKDFFTDHASFDDFFMLNLSTLTWAPIKMYGSAPRYFNFNYCFQLSEKYVIFLHGQNQDQDDNSFQISRFDITHFEWEKINVLSGSLESRIGGGFCYDEKTTTGFIFGGIYIQKSEPNSLTNEFNILKISEKKENFEKIHLIPPKLNGVDQSNNRDLSIEKDANEETDSDDDISFEELLEREKKLQEEERIKNEPKKSKKKKSKKKKESKI